MGMCLHRKKANEDPGWVESKTSQKNKPETRIMLLGAGGRVNPVLVLSVSGGFRISVFQSINQSCTADLLGRLQGLASASPGRGGDLTATVIYGLLLRSSGDSDHPATLSSEGLDQGDLSFAFRLHRPSQRVKRCTQSTFFLCL